jgi:hypothetical protein
LRTQRSYSPPLFDGTYEQKKPNHISDWASVHML